MVVPQLTRLRGWIWVRSTRDVCRSTHMWEGLPQVDPLAVRHRLPCSRPSLSDVISWGETDCALPVRPDVRPDRQDKTSRDQTFENVLTMTVLDDRVRSTYCEVHSFILRSWNICGGRKAMMIRVDL